MTATRAAGPVAGAAPRRDLLLVDGMFCAACAAAVEAALARIPGVAAARVDFATEAAVVLRDPERVSRSALVERIGALGYGARAAEQEHGGHEAAPATGPVRAAQRDLSLRLGVAVFASMWLMFPAVGLYLGVSDDPAVLRGLALAEGLLLLPVLGYAAVPFHRMAWLTLRGGVPGMDVLIVTGVWGSVGLSVANLAGGGHGVYFEVAAALVTLQLLARLFDLRVRGRARAAVAALAALAPIRLRCIGPDGRVRDTAPTGLAPGDHVLAPAGERLPVDGTVREGRALLDRSLVTGESVPVSVGPGDRVHAGERLLDASLRLADVAEPGRRRIDALASQVRRVLAERPPWQRAVDAFARGFLVLALGAAAIGAVLALGAGAAPAQAAGRALAVFVIACPCALALAAPAVALVAAGAAARRGWVLRDPSVITTAARPTVLFLDKTGTVTTGQPRVERVHTAPDLPEDAVLRVAAALEGGTRHPLAEGIRAAAPGAPVRAGVRAIPGRGVEADGAAGTERVGAGSWLRDLGIPVPSLPATSATRVHVARGSRWLGALDLRDPLRPGAAAAVAELRRRGVAVEILSGDGPAVVRDVAARLGVPSRAGLHPEAKVDAIRAARAAGAVVAFAGDGINDAPALAAADLGVAVGRSGDAARSAAAVTLRRDGVEVLPELLAFTARARRRVIENFGWAVVYNACAVPAALAGFVPPLLAALAMGFSSASVVLNATRVEGARARAPRRGASAAQPGVSRRACRSEKSAGVRPMASPR